MTTENGVSRVEHGSSSKREYSAPMLSKFGRVAALTHSASCSDMGDNDTVVACTPGAMAMMF